MAFGTDPVPVDLHKVERSSMQVTINADGKTRIRQVFEVAAPITGTVLRSPIRVGDTVKGGETVVAVVEPVASNLLDVRSRVQAEAAVREAEVALAQAQSRMREAREDLTLAERELECAKALVERGVASVTRLEIAEQKTAMKRAAQLAAISGLEMRKSAFDRARAALIDPTTSNDETDNACCMQLTAPADVKNLDIDVISEHPVIAGMRLLSVGQPDDLEIVADLLSADAVRLDIGDRGIVTRWGGATPLEARISKIEPSAYTKVSTLGIGEQRVDVVFDLVTPAEQRQELGDVCSVFLNIFEWEENEVLMVPISAIFRSGKDWDVFVNNGNVARHRVIEIGQRNTEVAQVQDGLSENELVVTHPSDDIADETLIVSRGAYD